MNNRGFFITGTDTGVGKTFVTSLLLRAGRSAGLDLVPMKPLCSGDRDDAEALHAACEGALPLNTINPVWYRTPAAPYTAAIVENRPVDMALIRDTFAQLTAAHEQILVEGAGGWLVPIERDYTIADLAAEMGLPVILIIRNKLGALNHALLTIRDIERRGLPFAGYIFNEPEPPSDVAGVTNPEILADLLGRPPLLLIGPGQTDVSWPFTSKASSP